MALFLIWYIMGPERCYQWEDYAEFIDNYYKSFKHEPTIENTSNALMENLGQEQPIVGVKTDKEEKPFQKMSDAKDALYFIDL